MAATAIVNTVLARNEAKDYTAPAAIDGTDGCEITLAADHKTLIILEATAATTATVKAGDALQGVGDLAVAFDAAGTKCLCLESGRFAKAGKVTITGASLKAACIVLP